MLGILMIRRVQGEHILNAISFVLTGSESNLGSLLFVGLHVVVHIMNGGDQRKHVRGKNMSCGDLVVKESGRNGRTEIMTLPVYEMPRSSETN